MAAAAPPLTEAEVTTMIIHRCDTLLRMLCAPNDCPEIILRNQRRLIREAVARLGPDYHDEPL